MKNFRLLFLIAILSIGAALSLSCKYESVTGKKGSGSAKSETRNVSGFKKIDASGAINVEVSFQNDYSVIIETDDNLLENIKTETSGDTLKIYSEGKISPTKIINVKISMPAIEGLNISGASSGNVANVKADSLEIKASGASKVKVAGEAKTLKADSNGASSIDAEGLKVENADIEASGASSATVSVVNELKANASGVSNIYYVGEPKNIKQDASGASSVKKK